ncbi:MAG: ABC transporter permease [Clostridiales Family XIII bacterium]|jgi:simple sugar transport system permease protein|nr:ABC transporter permease [Clostridiales Family XIII bacterium]
MKNRQRLFGAGVTVIAVLLAFAIGCIIIAAQGANPIQAMGYLFRGAFGNTTNISATLVRATPLIFTGLCACFAYRCGMFNLGGEGQFIMGAVVTVWVGVTWGVTGPAATLLCILLGTVAGGLWGAIPGILKVTRGLNEMIVSIMLNYVATLFMGLMYSSVMREGNIPQTPPVPAETQIPRIFSGVRVTWSIVIAMLLAAVVQYFLFRTSAGFRLRAVGVNSLAARYNGLDTKKYILFSFMVSGAIAGLGGSVEILGTQYRLISGFALGFGFDGVAIALIAQLNPIATVFVAWFFAILRTGATTMQVGSGVPTSVVSIIQALVIVFAVAGLALVYLPQVQQFFSRFTRRRKAEAAVEGA